MSAAVQERSPAPIDQAPIDTKRVTNRRRVRFESFDDVVAEAERLAGVEVRTLGNWSLPQIMHHLASSINAMIDGVPFSMPLPVRAVMRLMMKRKMLTETLPSGFKFPATAAKTLTPPDGVSTDEALSALREACQRAKGTPTRVMHPAFGTMTREEWDAFQLRHCEMHLSFIEPC